MSTGAVEVFATQVLTLDVFATQLLELLDLPLPRLPVAVSRLLPGGAGDPGAAAAGGLAVLGHPVRRDVLRFLARHGTAHRTTIALAVGGRVPHESLERLDLMLHHSHLPKLDAYHYIEYDPRSGDATLFPPPGPVESAPDSEWPA